MKPIEPGCLCWVVGYTNFDHFLGMSVEAVKKVHHGEFIKETGKKARTGGRPAWLCSTDESWIIFEEKNLKRLDGYDPSQDAEYNKRAVTC